MRVLALDTTTTGGSLALVDDDVVIAEQEGDARRSHTERLPGAFLDLARACATPLETIDVFAVAAGPGSFTGLRIGIAAMQGLASVYGKRIVPVSALEALAAIAAAGLPPGAIVAAWMDARRHEVFSARYRVGQGRAFEPRGLVEIDAITVGEPERACARWLDDVAPAVVIGDGATAYRALIGEGTLVIAPPPLAGAIGRIAALRAAEGGSLAPAAVQPVYVRRPDVEMARDRQASAAQSVWTLTAVTGAEGLDEVMAIDAASLTRPWTRDMYLKELSNQPQSRLVVVRDPGGRAVGFCSAWIVVDELHINNLAVIPEMRRKGAARALLRHVCREGLHQGAHRATLEVRRSNTAARQLYEACGFRVAGVRRDYYAAPVEDALVLWADDVRWADS